MALEEFWLLAVEDCLPPEIVILLLDVTPILPATQQKCFYSLSKPVDLALIPVIQNSKNIDEVRSDLLSIIDWTYQRLEWRL